MFSINKVTLMGRFVSSPTITDGDKSAISRARIKVTNGGNANVIPVIAFGTNANNLHAKGIYGDDIYLIGRIEMRRKMADDGREFSEASIVIDDFRVIQKPEMKSAEATYEEAVD